MVVFVLVIFISTLEGFQTFLGRNKSSGVGRRLRENAFDFYTRHKVGHTADNCENNTERREDIPCCFPRMAGNPAPKVFE